MAVPGSYTAQIDCDYHLRNQIRIKTVSDCRSLFFNVMFHIFYSSLQINHYLVSTDGQTLFIYLKPF